MNGFILIFVFFCSLTIVSSTSPVVFTLQNGNTQLQVQFDQPVTNVMLYNFLLFRESIKVSWENATLTQQSNSLYTINFNNAISSGVTYTVLFQNEPYPICNAPFGVVPPNNVTLIGNGNPSSCTEAAVQVIVNPGYYQFNCGPNPITISISSEISLNSGSGDPKIDNQPPTVVDGVGLVTLEASGNNRLISLLNPSWSHLNPHVTFQNIAFSGGTAPAGTKTASPAGGAIFFQVGTLDLVNCDFYGNSGDLNTAEVAGGAVNMQGGIVRFVGCRFWNNKCSAGGAIGFLGPTRVWVFNSWFGWNEANNNGGAIYSDGPTPDWQICGTVFRNNTSGMCGGAMFRTTDDNTGSQNVSFTRILVDRTQASSTSSGCASGGGLYIQGGHPAIFGSYFTRNTAGGGGAVRISFGALNCQIQYTVFAYNQANGLGGGLWLDGPSSNTGPTGAIDHTTFAFNTAPGSGSFDGATIGGIGWILSNSIFYNQSIGNIWNPLHCEGNQFREGGGNYQYPNKKIFCGGCSADVLCTPNSQLVDAKVKEIGPWEFCTYPESSEVGTGGNCSTTDDLYQSYLVTYVTGNVPLPRTPFCISFTIAGGQQNNNGCPTRPLSFTPQYGIHKSNGITLVVNLLTCTLFIIGILSI